MKKLSSSNTPLPPVSLEEVYSVVTAACSQDPTQLKDATDRLKSIVERPGALNFLHETSVQKSVPLLVRQQSIIQFKNNVGHWRSRRHISDEDRVQIRTRTWLFLDEDDDIIFNCHLVIIARIARADFSNNWLSLFPDLMTSINQGFDSCYINQTNVNPPLLRLRRSLQVLNTLIKELSSVKLFGGQKSFVSILEELHQPMYNYHISMAPVVTACLSPEKVALPRTVYDLIIDHLTYKSLVKISNWIWPKIEQEEFVKYQIWFQDFFQHSAKQLQLLFQQRISITITLINTQMPKDPGVLLSIDKLTRHIRVFGKFFRRIQQLSPKKFILLPECTDLILFYWDQVKQATGAPPNFIEAAIPDSSAAVFPVRFLVQAMVLFRESLVQWTPVRRDGTPNENVLTKEFVDGAATLLVTRFIPLTKDDLDNWTNDPEDWMTKEEKENDYWEFELRPCAERVLLALSSQYKQYVAVLLQVMFEDVIGRPAVELPEVILKEAVYCAVGRCSMRLKEVIPFEQCLQELFVVEAQNPNPNYPIIKRRVAWLIGKWISDECYPANNVKIWDILSHLLQNHGSGTDMAVRLTAVTALRECVDTISFGLASFEPFIAKTVTQLLLLIAEVETLESKRRILNTLNNVIQRSENKISPHVNDIVNQIPQLWSNAGDSGEGWLLKSVLVATVLATVEACKENSFGLVELVVPLVRECLSPEASLHLDRDGVALWLAALRNSGAVQPSNVPSGLFNLLPLLITLIANNLDLLGSITDIATSYYLLDAAQVCQFCAVDLFSAYNQASTHALALNGRDLLTSLGFLFQLAPASLWGEPLHHSRLFASMIKMVLNDDDKASTILLTEYIYTFARIALADRQIFLQLMSATAGILETPETKLWEGLLDQWWTRFDNMSEPKHRKLTAMGLASLVSTGRQEVLSRLPTEIANIWLDVFGEIKEQERVVDEENSPILSLYWDQPFSATHSEVEGTPEYERSNAVFNNDIVRTTQLTSFIQARLQEAEASVGGPQNLQFYLTKMDPSVLKQIEAVLKGTTIRA